MPKPYPPKKVSGDIDRIRAQTWNQLIDCLVYAMTHPRGDGITVLNTAADLLSAAGRGGNAPTAAAAAGGPKTYIVTQPPNGGFGVGMVREVKFTDGGANYEIIGDEMPMFFCHIGGPLV